MITTKRESYQLSESTEPLGQNPKRGHEPFWVLYIFFVILLAFFIIVITLITFRPYESSKEKLKPLGLMDWNYGGEDNKTSGNNNYNNFVTLNFDKQEQRQLRGQILSEEGIKVARFLGVRYAHQPKRFQKSFAADSWSGRYDALGWPPMCVQNNLHRYDYLTKVYNYNISEDCLFLNIWSPHLDVVSGVNQTNRVTGSRNGKNLLPVVIYLHGGGFSNMGISMEAYDGALFAALGKVVFVTANYRVGLFGFFNNDLEHRHKEYVANAGLYDQMLAIDWVRKNIQLFGGNPNVITLHGQSAGAISAGLHMISPVSQKLFQRAILQSASPMMMKPMFTTNRYEHIIELANCTTASAELSAPVANKKRQNNATVATTSTADEHAVVVDNDTEDVMMAEDEEDDDDDDDDHVNSYETTDSERRLAETRCLERLSLERLNEIQRIMLEENVVSFSPTLPSKFFPEFAEEALQRGVAEENTITQHEVLMGANANESTLYLHQEFGDIFPFREALNVSRAQLVHTMQKIFGNNALADNFISMVLKEIQRNSHIDASSSGGGDQPALTRQVLTFLGDFIFKGPVLKYAITLGQNTNTDVYVYEFHGHADHYPRWMGSGHWNEMDFVFGMPFRHRDKFSDKQRELSARIIQTWATFARTGKMLPQFGVAWPAFDVAARPHMNLAESNSSIGGNLDMSYYEFFDVMYEAF